jgi:DNA-binding response OmpR family regulator
MAMSEPPIVVAVFNTSPDTVDLLRIVLEDAGFVVVSAFTYDIRDGEVDLEAFCRQYAPRIVVYDISLPYDANWRLFLRLRTTPALHGVQFVITTTHAAHVQKLAGDQEIFEIVGKPYDLGRIVDKVRELSGRPA